MKLAIREDDLPLRNYDRQSAEAVAAKLRAFGQRELRLIGAYEADHANRPAVLERLAELTADEPWTGYDDEGADEIVAALSRADAGIARRVLAYERAHKSRAAVIRAAAESA